MLEPFHSKSYSLVGVFVLFLFSWVELFPAVDEFFDFLFLDDFDCFLKLEPEISNKWLFFRKCWQIQLKWNKSVKTCTGDCIQNNKNKQYMSYLSVLWHNGDWVSFTKTPNLCHQIFNKCPVSSLEPWVYSDFLQLQGIVYFNMKLQQKVQTNSNTNVHSTYVSRK